MIPYLNFYFLNVRLEEGEIIVLKDPQEAATIDMFDDERRENIDLQLRRRFHPMAQVFSSF